LVYRIGCSAERLTHPHARMTQLAQLIRRPARSPGLALFLLLLGWYVLTMSGHTYSSDEETMLAVAESLVESGTFALEPDFLMNYAAGGSEGQRYSRYGPGQSLAIVPFLLLGQAVAAAGPPFATGLIERLFVLLLPALVTAATALLLYAWARALEYGPRIALLVGLLYGLTTIAWPYSRTLFSEPLATLLLVLAAYGLRREGWRWWAVAGAAAAGALAVKVSVAIALLPLALYALLVSLRATPAASLRAAAMRAGAGLLGAALPLGLLLLYHTLLFGHPLTSGYGSVNPSGELGNPWQTGLHGLTFSTGKGLFVFAPALLLGLVGLGLRWRQQGREAALALAMLVVHLAFYSRLNYWHGDGSWGPRYLVFVVPFLMLPAAGVLAVLARWRNRLALALVGALAALSFAIQLLPVLFNFGTYLQLSDQYTRHFVPAASPIVGHTRLWFERLDEWSLRWFPPTGDGVVVLREGFSYSEGDRAAGELLPRWTYRDARMLVYPAAAHAGEGVDGRLVVGDHRPWPLERADFRLLLNGEPLDGVQRTDLTGDNVVWELRFTLAPQPADGATLTLHSDTWNPTRDTADNPRNEDLGLLLQEADFRQGSEPLTLREALPIPSPTADRRGLWLWYYDTPYHHLFDTWWWYVQAAGLPGPTLALLLALLGLPALAALLLGGRGVLLVLAHSHRAAAPRPAREQEREGAPGCVS
jgi:4-amino-4-deoxy-L-arabinose transferase-like glycosyltransferase